MNRTWVTTLAMLALALGSMAASAANAPDPAVAPGVESEAAGAQPRTPLAWSSLSSAQQQLLQPRAADWDTLPPARQRALARGAERWLSMPPQERAQARERSRPGANCPRSGAS